MVYHSITYIQAVYIFSTQQRMYFSSFVQYPRCRTLKLSSIHFIHFTYTLSSYPPINIPDSEPHST